MTKESFQILTLDGGGMRGLFSAAVLAAIEDDLDARITDHFDLIAGTSTGGLIALGLGLGLRPRELVDFYLSHGPKIFSNPVGWRSLQRWILRKYSNEPLERACREVFQEKRFGDSNKRLVIASYDLLADDVYLFRTPHDERLRRDYKVPAWKVALATTAAPTFFPSCHEIDSLRLIDGGVWANNPAMVALVEAVSVLEVPMNRVGLLSIGTYDPVLRRRSCLDWGGNLLWAPSVVEVLMRSQSIGIDNHIRFLIGEDRHTRVHPKVSDKEVALDRPGSARDLIGRAASHSRILMPEIAEKFMKHRAAPYEPIYALTQEAAD